MSARPPITIAPGAGTVLRAFGEEVTIRLGGAETGGKLCVFTEVTPPGGGPPPHDHEAEDEWFMPLQGRVEFLLEGTWREVPVGATVFVPRGAVHTFRNPGQAPLEMLIHTMPAGFETFFARCAEEFAKPTPPDMARIAAIGAEHGIHFVE